MNASAPATAPVLPIVSGRTGFLLTKNALHPALLALGFLGLLACSAGEDAPVAGDGMVALTPSAARVALEVVDDAGRTVRLDGPARRIVSLLPAATETVVRLGAGDRLVGRNDYDPAIVAHLPSVGGGLTPSMERIAALEPDLVIAWEEAGGARTRPRLEQLGIPVFAARTVDTADIYANIRRFGVLLDTPTAADSLAGWMRDELAAVRASVEGRDPVAALYLVGTDPPTVAGPRVFIGELLRLAGGRNVFGDLTIPSPQVSLEEVVRRRPEVVLVPTEDGEVGSVARLGTAPGWRELWAQGTRLEALPSDLLHRPGPSIVEAAWAIRDALYPDLARAR